MSTMIETLKLYLQYPFVRYALIVGVLIALCSSVLGVTLVLKRFSFIGDGLSHVGFGALATVAYAYMDRLAARYGSDAHSGRVLLLFALALMNVWQLIFLIWMTFSAT